MMTSNLFTHLRPPNNDSPSIYETILRHEEESENSDVEERSGLALDTHNLQENSHELDLENANTIAGQVNAPNAEPRQRLQGRKWLNAKASTHNPRPRWMQKSETLLEVEEADDEVPASLLIEGNEDEARNLANLPPPHSAHTSPIPVKGAASRRAQQQWQRTQAQQGLHTSVENTRLPGRNPTLGLNALSSADPREKAMWRWANVENLDNFLSDVYYYYQGNGFWSIMLGRSFKLITFAFVVGFLYFLGACVDYGSIRGSNQMSQILIPRCMSKMGLVPNVVLWFTTLLWTLKLFQFITEIRRLKNMKEFYYYLLDINETDIQTISWQDIVSRLMALRDANPNTTTNQAHRATSRHDKQRMDAHDIANRLMRKDNYFIAMINKDILDTTLPIPFLSTRQFYSKCLEWHIHWCIMDYVFNAKGEIRRLFVKDTHRRALSNALRRRFVFAGTANLVLAPFLIIYFLVQYFFQYFNEYQKNPAQIGSRTYNSLALWKFREFNELWHLFEKRINMSHPFATRYINQFPKAKTIQTARFVTFVSGALTSVLALASVIDPELFLGFEITPDRTVLFYLGLFGTIWAVARGMLPEDNLVYEPEFSLREVIDFTHYKPAHWDNQLHSDAVRSEFAQLYQMKVVIFLNEILSMVFTPFVLWFSLPKCSDRIIDFFREFTVHVDGIGYVCAFAEFNFKQGGIVVPSHQRQNSNGAVVGVGTQDPRDDYFATKDQKLEASYWGFMNDYARNPKTDIRFPYARPRANPPPPPPVLFSPNFPATELGAVTARHLTSPRKSLGTPRFAAQSSSSPLTSILLDPHHQPSSSGFGSSGLTRPRSGVNAQAKFKSSAKTLKEDDESGGAGDSNRAAAGPLLDQSNGELRSWKYDEDEREDSDDEEEDIDAVTGAKGGGGILGLIRQFQRAQGQNISDGHGGVGI